ncbi:MAG: MarR family transcriptional regulator [Methanomassiliicoccaceae archaeon]|nr:MarR family transcriptional regulator [Methanomassiliicoccaceae archaeon]
MVLANYGRENIDYEKLAEELLRNMRTVGTAQRQRSINEGVHGEAFVLQFIRENDCVIPGKISEAMSISSARIAAALNSLEDKEFITRNIDNEDRRRIIVKLTEKGKDHADEQRKGYIRQIKGILIALGEDDAKEYVRILGKMAKVLSGTDE